MLDRDLAKLYGVDTGALNRAVKRNAERFPEDFMFQITAEEEELLRCQIGISKPGRISNTGADRRSQFATSNRETMEWIIVNQLVELKPYKYMNLSNINK